MAKSPIHTTAPGAAHSLDEPAKPSVLAFVILWSASQPERAGEVAFLPYAMMLFLGRGDEKPEQLEKFVHFDRRRPGEVIATDLREGLLTGRSLSRLQLLLCATAVAVEVKRIGRCDLLVNGVQTENATVKPGDTVMLRGELLLLCVRREIDLPHPGGFIQAFGEPDAAGMIGESAAAWRLRHRLAVIAPSSDHVMIQGPSGAGKELAVAAIQQGSQRVNGPFVKRNVANISPELRHAELFGNLKNYPNPGMPERGGIIGAADGGTLFLDEVGECALETQTALMRVLDQGDYERLGEGISRRADLRLIAATNSPDSAFKPDFLSRFLARVPIPPLREHAEDIPLLVRHWLLNRARNAPKEAGRFIQTGPSGRPEPKVSARLIDYLVRQPLELNVRELHGLLLVAMHASPGDEVKMPLLPDLPAGTTTPPASGAAEAQRRSKPPVSKPVVRSKEEIVACLERHGGNITHVAEEFGMDRSTLRHRMKKLGIKIRKEDDT